MTNPYNSPTSDLIMEDGEWKRSKWLTGWLWFMFVMTLINIPTSYLMSDAIVAQAQKMTMPIIYTLMVASVVSAVSVFAIIKNKKWGVFGVCAVVVLAFGINFYTLGIKAALTGLIGAVILFFLLFKGGKNSAWSKLR
ncbi:hypothetical protein [Shewanella sp. YLB-07]|uniref:hypothetical protein n=1 Tax=Shewanella sp. YLB-07 TaxID=2601268 RepID=UPI00128BA104|nr:hypothetical protein [Shewanella sp. YLB-07]MPY26199.1 hypothetical protein [Shewanella sp. YLB-07]